MGETSAIEWTDATWTAQAAIDAWDATRAASHARDEDAARGLRLSLLDAVLDTYDAEGVGLWLREWRNADPDKRGRMETGVMSDGNG